MTPRVFAARPTRVAGGAIAAVSLAGCTLLLGDGYSDGAGEAAGDACADACLAPEEADAAVEAGAAPADGGRGADRPCTGPSTTVRNRRPGAARSVPLEGAAGASWSSPGEARVLDSRNATSAVSTRRRTDVLLFTDFGIEPRITGRFRLLGVRIVIRRDSERGSCINHEDGVRLYARGSPVGVARRGSHPFWSAAPPVVTSTYGSSVDVGFDLEPAAVLAPDFGFGLRAFCDADDVARVDGVLVSVTVCPID